ncbi:receptor-like protein EIX2 [Gastrolobium bilobum]|uniref:receptor-like protein EIX2 n=1 Tax=Gastrolobium bilobum TaxID=150636 RepID=UPI002AAF37E9|nr:receptor-like protein EIX2 [Gastrolobium bilobum]
MSKLESLDLSDNSLTVAFSKNWIPSFQLHSITLRSCKLGPAFPKWLQTQNNIIDLDISHNGISDIVPEWFWAKFSFLELSNVNLSYNNLKGTIPNFPVKNIPFSLTLTSNQFEGPIPTFMRGFVTLDLSINKFSDSLEFFCANGTVETLAQLDLSNNQLSGQIPDCWSHFKSLAYLDLSHNNFSGKVPTSMGSLLELQALLLRNNSLNEGIPFSLRHCTKLVMLDLAENRLSRPIPPWIGGEFQELQILSLGRNHLYGSLPLQLCSLKSIQLLDLSWNNLSGPIPKCFKNFISMAQKNSSRDYPDHVYDYKQGPESGTMSYELNEFLMWKGAEQLFKNNQLFLLKSIDLSNNHFSEEIPAELENLFGLVSLNLSRNNLTGKIPSNIGRLTSLEFLDLSRNQISGSIPSSLAQIDRLAMLDLSHNHLSGEIPIGTQLQSFDASKYEDNLDLCGKPLDKLCMEAEPPNEPKVKSHEDEHLLFTRGFYVSMAFGFVIGFWGIFGSILVNRSCRHAYFRILNNLVDSIYVMIAIKVAKYKRWLKH